VKNNGIGYAMTRLKSYYSNQGMFEELTRGLEYYRFVTDLTTNFDTKSEEIIQKLAQTASILFNQKNMIVNITCSDDNYPVFAEGLNNFIASLPEGDGQMNDWKFDLNIKNEGLMSASKVQYVIKGYNFKKLGYEWNGKMQVMDQILSTDYLQTKIRVMGGAYGGFSGFSSTGNAYFGSYRDPNLKETLENYDLTPEFLKNFEAEEKEITRYIIGTISNMDMPTVPSQRGSIAFYRYLTKKTIEELKAERTEILSTTTADIVAMEKMIQDILAQNAICVYGNDEKIKANKDLFGNIFNVTK
jgi:hypothetical protein